MNTDTHLSKNLKHKPSQAKSRMVIVGNDWSHSKHRKSNQEDWIFFSDPIEVVNQPVPTRFLDWFCLIAMAMLCAAGIYLLHREYKGFSNLNTKSIQENTSSNTINEKSYLAQVRQATDGLLRREGGMNRVVRHFNDINLIGGFFTQYKKDFDGAIDFFSKIENDPRFSDAEQDIMKGWVGISRELKDIEARPKENSNQFFQLAERHYKSALRKVIYPNDPVGAADLSLAAGYLIPFIKDHSDDVKVGEALYMMGDIRRRSWDSQEQWSGNYYFTEVIKRFPHTALALRSWEALNDDVHFGYTGSAGDFTPKSWIMLLDELKARASPNKSI